MPFYFLSHTKTGPVTTDLHRAGVPGIDGSPLLTVIIVALVLAIVAALAVAARRSARS